MTDPERRLRAALARHEQLTIAVSGGVDSLTLATVAGRAGEIAAAHAVSPAVPEEATARVRRFAEREGWTLHVLDAREFDVRRQQDYVGRRWNGCRRLRGRCGRVYDEIRVFITQDEALE